MAQTTHLASFGPFFIFVGLRWPSLGAVGLVGFRGRRPGQLWVWWVRNKLYILKKLTYGPNDARCVVWALFHLCKPALAFVGCCGPSWSFVAVVRANYGCGG